MRVILLQLLAWGFLTSSAAFAQTTPATTNDVHALHNDIVTWGKNVVSSVQALPASDTVVGSKLDTLHADLQAILAQLKAQPTGAGTADNGNTATGATPPANITYEAVNGVLIASNLADPCKGRTDKWATLTLHATDSVARAMACAAPKFKLTLAAGNYHQTWTVPPGLDGFDIGGESAATVKVHALGCTTTLNNGGSGCMERLAWGKGVIHLQSAGTVHDMELADGGIANVGNHDLQAGLYVEAGVTGTVTATHIMFRNNQNGMASNLGALGVNLVLTEDDFVGNSTDGGSHSSYLGGGKSVTYNNIHDYGSTWGNDQKSRIPKVTVNGGYFKSKQGRWVEAAEGAEMTIGGNAVFVGNTCCANVFGNGDENTNKAPTPSTKWSDSTIWLGRSSSFWAAGTFQATNIKLLCGSPNANPFNNVGTVPLTGLPTCAANAADPEPAAPPYISGAK